MNKKSIKKLVLSALFLAIGQVLPFITGQIPAIGNMLSPMHLPILLCGYICGPFYGLLVGTICPLLRSVLFGMPRMFPNAIAMAFELATYGLTTGLLYRFFKSKKLPFIYLTLILSMITGRIVWGIIEMILLSNFTWQMFMAGAFINAIPGIIIQLILIPLIIHSLQNAHFI